MNCVLLEMCEIVYNKIERQDLWANKRELSKIIKIVKTYFVDGIRI